jgi:hypothetical protein
LDFFSLYCFIYRSSDSTVSEDARIESRTIATSALAVIRSIHSARSHPLILIEYKETWAAIQRQRHLSLSALISWFMKLITGLLNN